MARAPQNMAPRPQIGAVQDPRMMRQPGNMGVSPELMQALSQSGMAGLGGTPTGGPGMGNPYSYNPMAARAMQGPPGHGPQPGAPPTSNADIASAGWGTGTATPQSQAALNNVQQQHNPWNNFWNQITGRGGQTGNTPSTAGNDPLNPMNNAIQPGFGSNGYGYSYGPNGQARPNQAPVTNAQGQTVNPITAQLEAWRNMQAQQAQNRPGIQQQTGNMLNMQRYMNQMPPRQWMDGPYGQGPRTNMRTAQPQRGQMMMQPPMQMPNPYR